MEKFNISKLTWKQVSSKIKTANKDFYALANPIAKHLNSIQKDFVYSLKLKFGQRFIEDSKMVVLKRDSKNDFENKSLIHFSNNQTENEKHVQEFLNCIGNTGGHPLSLIVENYIEIYCHQRSPYSLYKQDAYSKEYSFPLNQLMVGDMFGVWEAIHLIINDNSYIFEGWDAVAGKRCFKTTLPENKPGLSSNEYRSSFASIFNDMPTAEEGFISLVNEKHGREYFTEILIIPEHFYKHLQEDNENIQLLKSRLRELIFKIGWQQEETIKIATWKEKEIFVGLSKKDIGFIFYLRQHFVNMATNKAFGLKPVDKSDSLFFDVVQDLVTKFKEIKQNKNSGLTLLDYNFPLFFHYSLLQDADWLFEMTHSPSINIMLPQIKLEEFKPTIEHFFIDSNNLKTLLDRNGISSNIVFYAEKSKTAGKKTKSMEDFINERLSNIYNSLLGNQKSLVISKYPWFFNGLMVIEKIK